MAASKWFTTLEDVIYAPVEYIPLVGTVYSFKRIIIADKARDKERYWVSMVNFVQGVVRDAILLSEAVEPVYAVIIHDMADALTDKLAPIFSSHNTFQHTLKKGVKLEPAKYGYVIMAGKDENQSRQAAERAFKGKAEGIHHFHSATFEGKLVEPSYAPNGETIQLFLPEGFRQGAMCIYTWKWTKDASGVKDRPDNTSGLIVLPEPNKFGFQNGTVRGFYDFWGWIINGNTLNVTTSVNGKQITFPMKRK